MYKSITFIKRFVPTPLRKPVKRILFFPAKKALFFGRSHFCPVCDSRVRKFLTNEELTLPNYICPVCYSFERHRLAWTYFRQATVLPTLPAKRMLHLSPEEGLRERFMKTATLNCITGDLNDPNAMVKMDVTDLPCRANSFDWIYCSHVLEHVQDDRKAMRELNRVLKPGGCAVLQVPIGNGATLEDSSVTSPVERKRLFGQSDHVRRYGRDFETRLREAEFDTEVYTAGERIGTGELQRMGIPLSETLFLCRK